jgi:DNA-binding MarR family transcriptional regulator
MDVRDALLQEIEGRLVTLNRRLRTFGRGELSLTQLTLLSHLEKVGSLSMTELAEHMGVTVAGATGLVDRLERDGLVARARDERDRRLVLVQLTPQGGLALAAARRRKSLLLRQLAASLDDRELATLAALLERLTSEAKDGSPGRGES